VTDAERPDHSGSRRGPPGLVDDDHAPTTGPLERVAAWLQATPAELVGLLVLLLGAVAGTLVLWSDAAARPSQLPAPSSAVVGGDGPADVGQPVAGSAPGSGAGPGTGEGAGSAGPAGDAFDGPGAGDGPGHGAGTDAGGSVPAGPLTVHVSGAVAQPGLVTVPAGARVGDAVAAAGGFAADADPAAVNLARPLGDGEQVHVPAEGEPRTSGTGPAVTAPDPAGGGAGGGVGAIDADGRVDLNRASEEELQTLPGVGPARAAAIIEHRERHGPFAEAGDLRAVSGIGEKTFQSLADRIVVR
jgi:competence protein ComEA